MMRQRWRRRALRVLLWVLVGVGAAGLLVLVVWAVWRIPQTLYTYVPEPKDRASVESSTRTGMVAGLAGLAALGSLVLTTRTYRLTQQGQITDRYTKAIAHLGDDKLDVRLGGIYALERIAVDSKRDHPTVVEVLSAFVRERGASAPLVRPARRRTGYRPSFGKRIKVGADVQAALTVLGRLPRRTGVSRGDLSQADLTRADLMWADLARADFSGANLTGARLCFADLTLAYFERANLTLANLTRAKLARADLTAANLTKARLIFATFTGTCLTEANLTEAEITRTDLTGARDLSQHQIDTAQGDDSTTLPTTLRRPETWHLKK